MSLRQLVFVAMPFGKKVDFGGMEIDFDDVYQNGIKPAAQKADLDIIRADEEKIGGFIHAPMYERLLLAEIVVADLTLANPNVFYELGIRHAARPRSTILIYREGSQLPFDVSPLRAIPYRVEIAKLANPEQLVTSLAERLEIAKADSRMVDSPLYQLFPQLPPISLPHEVTESFRDRVKYIDATRAKIEVIRLDISQGRNIEALKAIEEELASSSATPLELWVDLLLAYRDLSAWEEVVALYDRLPDPLKTHSTVREQYAMALNRRNNPSDREKAVAILRCIIAELGPNPETCGILGRVYKDRYRDAHAVGNDQEAEAYLDEAIKWYKAGFEADPRDYYPGINAATLLCVKGTPEALDDLRQLLPVVSFAVARRGGLGSSDYWDVATVLEIAVLGQDWDLAERAAARLLVLAKYPWTVKTTLDNLRDIARAFAGRRLHFANLENLIKMLENKLVSLQQDYRSEPHGSRVPEITW